MQRLLLIYCSKKADFQKPEASDDIALWLADEFTQVSPCMIPMRRFLLS